MSRSSHRRTGGRPGSKGVAGNVSERIFSRALEHHRAGRWAEAESGYQQVLASSPNHAGALYYLALLLEESGRRTTALEHMARAVAARPGDAVLRNNYGNMQRAAGQLRQAAESYRAAVASDSGYLNAYFNLGTVLEDMDDHAGAESAFRRVIADAGDDDDAWNGLGIALLRQDRAEEALDCFRTAAALNPKDSAIAYNHAGCLNLLGRRDQAADEYHRAIALDPGSASAHYGLALVEMLREDKQAAEACLRETLRIRPDHAPARAALASLLRDSGRLEEEARSQAALVQKDPDNLVRRTAFGELLLEMDRWEEAARQFEFVAARQPGDGRAQNGLSRAYVNLRRIDDAVAAARRAITHQPGLADAHCNLGVALRQKGRIDEAVDAYQEAIRLDPRFAAAWNNLGLVWMDKGDITRAQECYREAIRLDPDTAAALMNLSRSKKFGQEDLAEIEQTEAMLSKPDLSHDARANLHFALGKMYEDCGQFDRAFSHYRHANEMKKERLRFDPENYLSWVEKFPQVFNGEFFQRCRGFGNASERPVFIVGMPRSGTTLVEQILSSHPEVFGADELTKMSDIAEQLSQQLVPLRPYPDCVESLDSDTAARAAEEYLAFINSLADEEKRVSDKMPTNFFHLGLIALLFPNARVIHCRRDPMDVALSNYVQLFAEGHYYSYDLRGIAVYYRGYENVMAHWRRVLPLRMHEVRYETLVENQEPETRRLVEFLGLPWDDRCLNFHRTERSVRTASNWQVRQPIYKSSTRRWKRFAAHLQELERELAGAGQSDEDRI